MPRNKGTKDISEGKNVNICTGCSHDCIYCYARASAFRFKQIESVDEWKNMKVRKKDVERKYKEKWDYAPLFPSSHDVTPEILDDYVKALGNFLAPGNAVNITSKPHLECIKAICKEYGDQYRDKIRFMFTITSNNDKVLSFWEPGAPDFAERLACLKYAADAGFRTRVFIEPMLDPDNLEALVNEISPYVSMDIWIGKLHHAKRIKAMYPARKEIHIALDMLEAKYTDERLVELYKNFENNPLVYWKTGTLPEVLENHPLFEVKTTNMDKLARKSNKKKKVKKITKYQLHPVASAFPEMPISAFDSLKRSIKENGLRHPIVLHDGKIVDGKNRYRACSELGIEPKVRKWDGKGSLTDFVCDMNIARRDLSTNQRYTIALKLKQAYAREAKENQRLSKGRGKKGSCPEHKPLDARKMACRKARVGERSLAMVEELHKKAPDLFDWVFRGDMSLTGAMKSLTLRENPEYFDDVVGHLCVEWALPDNTWVCVVRCGRETGAISMRIRHQSENGLKPEVLKQLDGIPIKSYWFEPLDDIEKHLLGQITTEEAKKRARAKQGLKKMKDNILKFQGKQARPKETETKTVEDAKRELKKRGVL